MSSNWKALKEELDVWFAEGLTLPIWWRDDDAVEPTAELERLEAMAAGFEIPVHLAVIPKFAQPALADAVSSSRVLVPVVHGFAHVNHELADVKKAEFGASRNPDQVVTDIRDGLEKTQILFGMKLAPMFVPPWNRIAPVQFSKLSEAGYRAVSTFTPRTAELVAHGLYQINTHVDPIDWHGSRSVHDEDRLVSNVVEILKARRAGTQDNAEPLGYLTHHLVHDPAIWDFTERFLDAMKQGPVRMWDVSELTKKGRKT